MHNEITELIHELDLLWGAELGQVIKEVREMITKKAPSYDNVSPVWMRLATPAAFQTIISIKANRILSQLEALDSLEETWNPDNAIDLMVYTAFLIAYSRFAKTQTKGNDNGDMPNFPNEPT